MITLQQRGERNNRQHPRALECSGLNVKQHCILVNEYVYFENLRVATNANNGIYFKYTPCFGMLPPGGYGYKKKPLFTYFSPHYNMDFHGP